MRSTRSIGETRRPPSASTAWTRFTDYGDAEGYRASAQRAAALGFEGKWAIHPSQLALANEVFSPSADQLAWAARITQLMESTTRGGQGAVGSEGVLIDMAHLKLADSISQRQALIASHAGHDSA